jgi:hypothetical protein
MSKPALNLPDLAIGIGLALLFPLAGYLLIAGGGQTDDPAVAEAKKGAPLTIEELEETKAEYKRMYEENVRNYLSRAEVDEKNRRQEETWARGALERARKGLGDLITRAKANPASQRVQEAVPGLEALLRTVEGDLKKLPGGASGSPAAPPR